MKAVADIALRAFKTAVQTFVSVTTVAQVLAVNIDALEIGLGSAAAAGLSVIWNAIEKWASTTEVVIQASPGAKLFLNDAPPPPPEAPSA